MDARFAEELRLQLQEMEVAAADIAAKLRSAATLLDHVGESAPLIRADVVATWLDVTPRCVTRQIALGEIPAVRIGRRWMVLRDLRVKRLEVRFSEDQRDR